MTKIHHKQWIGLSAALLLLLACGLFAQQPSPTTDVAVIVNPLNPVESISFADLHKIFAGDKQSWSGNQPVFVFVRAPQARERVVLLERVMHMTESEYRQYWIKKLYSGEVQHEPLALMSNGMQLEAVRSDKGAIALISVQDLHPGVKVLKVDGRMPGAPGYLLK
jgi:ABC-type phosphate transport system substrate-binding protein